MSQARGHPAPACHPFPDHRMNGEAWLELCLYPLADPGHDRSRRRDRMRIDGKCHCGNISFSLDWPGETDVISARACGCTFCTKHGGVWTSKRSATLYARVRNRAAMSECALGTETATFHVCSRCGAVPFVSSKISDRLYAVVNVNTFEDIAPSLVRREGANFDGEGVEMRLSRRTRNWIDNVRIEEGS